MENTFIWDFPTPEHCLECTLGSQGCCKHQLSKCCVCTETFAKSPKLDWIKWWRDQKITRGREETRAQSLFLLKICVYVQPYKNCKKKREYFHPRTVVAFSLGSRLFALLCQNDKASNFPFHDPWAIPALIKCGELSLLAEDLLCLKVMGGEALLFISSLPECSLKHHLERHTVTLGGWWCEIMEFKHLVSQVTGWDQHSSAM